MKNQHVIALFFSLILSLALFLTLAPTEIYAQGPITVTTAADDTTDDDLCTLREAITNANNDAQTYDDCPAGSGADGITFAANYTITLTSALPTITSSVTITGNGTANTIIQASTCNPFSGGCITATHRVFTVMTTTATLKDMTVRHGACKTGGNCLIDPEDGGNIYTLNTNLTLDAVNVQSGYAQDYGGGIYSDGGTLTIQNNSLIGGAGAGNQATGSDGGGIFLDNGGTLTVDNSQVSYNQSVGYGGGIDNRGGTLNVQNGSRIEYNTALEDNGGGINSEGTGCQVNVDASTIANNNAGNSDGGGLYSSSCTNTISNSTFSANQADQKGGGMYLSNGATTVSNSTFSGNSATTNGGGIYKFYGSLSVLNSTVSGNSATAGAGIYGDESGLTLKNSILANSTSGTEDCFSNAPLAADTNNLIENNSGCGTPASTADPMLGPLADNGGKTQTLALLLGSPALDTGDNATCAAAPVNNLDQRGMTRPYGGTCDIGAFEWPVATLYLPIVLKNN